MGQLSDHGSQSIEYDPGERTRPLRAGADVGSGLFESRRSGGAMKRLLLLLIAIPLMAQDLCPGLPALATIPDNMLARKPIMGWNSWYVFGSLNIDESVIKQHADALV